MAATCAGSLGPSRSLCWPMSLSGWLEVGSFPPGPHLACGKPHVSTSPPAPSLRVKGKGKCPALPHSSRSCLSSVTGWRWRSRTTSPNKVYDPLSEICFWGESRTIFNFTAAFAKIKKNNYVSIVISLPAD